MLDKRPKNLNLMTIRFPLPAIVSILHRMSGVFLFLMIPLALWLLDYSLSPDGYLQLSYYMDSLWLKALFWVMLCALFYHLIAGVRHLLADLHLGDTLKAGRLTAKLVFVVSIIVFISLGIWLW